MSSVDPQPHLHGDNTKREGHFSTIRGSTVPHRLQSKSTPLINDQDSLFFFLSSSAIVIQGFLLFPAGTTM
jgi:hypothetical protein